MTQNSEKYSNKSEFLFLRENLSPKSFENEDKRMKQDCSFWYPARPDQVTFTWI